MNRVKWTGLGTDGKKNNLDCELIDSCRAGGCQAYFVRLGFARYKKCSEAGSPRYTYCILVYINTLYYYTLL